MEGGATPRLITLKEINLEFKHIPVLLNECINGLNIKSNGIYVDGTLGGAGHSSEIIKQLSSDGLLIGIDRDQTALSVVQKKLSNYSNIKYIHGNHDDIKSILKKLDIDSVDGILLDLGVSSYQLDEATRGFSYMQEANLDMRMDTSSSLTAEYVINNYSEQELSKIIFEYGEDKFSKKIANAICEYRKNKKIETTKELVSIIANALPAFAKKDGHPAKRTFQAIRIEVNNEIKPLYNTISTCINLLKKGGRICVITFHSLEDRAVKDAFIDAQGKCVCPGDLPYCICNFKSKGKILTKKPILPTKEEITINSRSKSAKLRIFEKN